VSAAIVPALQEADADEGAPPVTRKVDASMVPTNFAAEPMIAVPLKRPSGKFQATDLDGNL
jgi:hypothetical protein